MSKAPALAISGEVLDQEANVPEGWVLTVLDDAGHWMTGGTPSRKISQYFKGTIPWVKSGDLNDGIVKDTEEKITKAGLQNSAAKLLPVGTISIALYGATIGKLGLLEIEAATNQACANCVVDSNLVDRKYLFFYLLHERQALVDAGQGGAQPNLTNRIVRDWPFPLAPLSEQRRIASTVDALLALLDKSMARLSDVEKLLKAFRRSVLASACSGHLTEDWREKHRGIESASTLVESVYRNRQEQYAKLCRDAAAAGDRRPSEPKNLKRLGDRPEGFFELPDGWEWVLFDEVCDDITVGHVGPMTHEYVDRGIPFLRSQNVREFLFDPKGLKYISPRFNERLAKSELHPGDVAIVRSGYPGVACVIPDSLKLANCADLVIVRPSPPLDPHYMCTFINSTSARAHVSAEKVGIAQSHFNVGAMRSTPLPVPPLEEQHEIVRRVQTLFALAAKIEARVAVAANRADKLTQAILARAFRGELISTEAELARQERRDYEPASVLLDRIKADRAQQNKSHTQRGRIAQ